MTSRESGFTPLNESQIAANAIMMWLESVAGRSDIEVGVVDPSRPTQSMFNREYVVTRNVKLFSTDLMKVSARDIRWVKRYPDAHKEALAIHLVNHGGNLKLWKMELGNKNSGDPYMEIDDDGGRKLTVGRETLRGLGVNQPELDNISKVKLIWGGSNGEDDLKAITLTTDQKYSWFYRTLGVPKTVCFAQENGKWFRRHLLGQPIKLAFPGVGVIPFSEAGLYAIGEPENSGPVSENVVVVGIVKDSHRKPVIDVAFEASDRLSITDLLSPDVLSNKLRDMLPKLKLIGGEGDLSGVAIY